MTTGRRPFEFTFSKSKSNPNLKFQNFVWCLLDDLVWRGNRIIYQYYRTSYTVYIESVWVRLGGRFRVLHLRRISWNFSRETTRIRLYSG